MQVTLENLICCIGAGAIIDCDCISCCCRFCKRWDGHGQCKRQHGKQCYEFFHVLHWFYVSLLKYFGLLCPHRWRGYFKFLPPPEWLRLLMRYPNISAMPIIRAPAAVYGGVPAAPVAGSS